MKPLPVAVISMLLGGGVGFALALRDVGNVETSLYPPAAEASPVGGPSDRVDPDAPVGPLVEVDSEVHDFGSMQRGLTESHEFLFTNKGSAPLKLEVGRTTCKCTLGEVEDRPIEPGESIPVRLEWVAKSLPGSFQQTATVHTNDPRRPTIELSIEGLITELVGLKPDTFMFSEMRADEVNTASVYLASFEDSPDAPPLEATVRLSESTPNPEQFRLEVEPVAVEELPVDGATSGVKITAHAGPGLPIGILTEWVLIDTNLSKTNADGTTTRGVKLQAPMYGRVEGDLSIHGAGWSREKSVLNLGKVRSAEGAESKLLLSFKGKNASQMRASFESADPDWLEVDLEDPREVREGVYHQVLIVRIPQGRSSEVRSGKGEDDGGVGQGDARVRLAISHPTTTELDLRVRFVIAE